MKILGYNKLTACFLIVGLATISTNAATVAKVGNKKISLKEFKKRFTEVKDSSFNPPGPLVFLEDLVRYEVGIQEAYKQKIDKSPMFKERMKQELYKLLLEKSISSKIQKIKVTEKDMRKVYKKYPEIRTSHILIEYKTNATKKQIALAKKNAHDIYKKVKKSKRPFEELVKLYSDDLLSKAAGGDIGYQSRVTTVSTYYDKANALKMKKISKPIRTKYGFHIIKLTGRRTFEQSDRTQIRAMAFEEKKRLIFNRYFAGLKKKYKIKKYNKLVKNVK